MANACVPITSSKTALETAKPFPNAAMARYWWTMPACAPKVKSKTPMVAVLVTTVMNGTATIPHAWPCVPPTAQGKAMSLVPVTRAMNGTVTTPPAWKPKPSPALTTAPCNQTTLAPVTRAMIGTVTTPHV